MKTFTRTLATATALSLTTPALATAPAGRYTIKTETVLDTKTGLTWQRQAPTDLFNWTDAKAYCASRAVNDAPGGPTWRLPTKGELQTLVDYSVATGARIDATAFPDASDGGFWSATPVAGSPNYAWYVSFGKGYTIGYDVTSMINVRCVR